MEPQVQYCTAPDGVNLAFCTEGQGSPIIYLPWIAALGHLQIDALFPDTRRMLEYLTPRMNVIRYDRRGQGLSDRDVADDSLEAHVGDLLTIVDRLAIERVALYARGYNGPLAILFAQQHPERVTHLIFAHTAARMAEVFETSRMRATNALLDIDWELFTEVLPRLFLGWSEHDLAVRLTAQMRAANTPESTRRTRDIVRTWDVSGLLAQIVAPTLVMHLAEWRFFPGDRWPRQLAAGIPGAQLRVFDRVGPEAVRAVYQFVTGEEAEPEPESPQLPEGTAIILFADIVDSTALTEQLGDAVFRARASRLDAAMRSGIRECGGTPVEGKVMGDGVMAVFSAARQAIDAAFRCRAAADGTGLALHLGIHAGDVTREGANVYGGAVNVASRICGLSVPDEILVSATVRDLARTSAAAAFDDRGEHQLKGIAEPVRVYAVRAQLT
jgi:class 3 adenylate cyclase/pimeloyl-ACP methyl ester carboxylesterase